MTAVGAPPLSTSPLDRRRDPACSHTVKISEDNICEARFSLYSARNLELATEDSD